MVAVSAQLAARGLDISLWQVYTGSYSVRGRVDQGWGWGWG